MASLQGIDPALKEYIRVHQLPDVYEVLTWIFCLILFHFTLPTPLKNPFNSKFWYEWKFISTSLSFTNVGNERPKIRPLLLIFIHFFDDFVIILSISFSVASYRPACGLSGRPIRMDSSVYGNHQRKRDIWCCMVSALYTFCMYKTLMPGIYCSRQLCVAVLILCLTGELLRSLIIAFIYISIQMVRLETRLVDCYLQRMQRAMLMIQTHYKKNHYHWTGICLYLRACTLASGRWEIPIWMEYSRLMERVQS